MAGIYIHIPFCKQKCSYCDFHFSTDSSYRDEMMVLIGKELDSRLQAFQNETVETIYFGGGTPSLIRPEVIKDMINKASKGLKIIADLEVTLEANPEDMQVEALKAWKEAGVNRLSIGVQSFDEALLRSMNRSHSADEARQAIQRSKDLGFNSISVDIIFGLPLEGTIPFEDVVKEFLALDVNHISAYALTLEKRTAYQHRFDKGELTLPDENEVQRQFTYLIDSMLEHGYEQYEVSNFARAGHISRHNSAYWKGLPYLGVGPSAHSFDGMTRRWNVANNRAYMDKMKNGEVYWEEEAIDSTTAFNEYLMTRTRTKWGLDLNYIQEHFGIDLLKENKAVLGRYDSCYEMKEDHLILNRKGLLLADRFASDLFKV
jgi:oxygen-independent coproporphyrinogen-3 oxidase